MESLNETKHGERSCRCIDSFPLVALVSVSGAQIG
jgi:hypothetical protein